MKFYINNIIDDFWIFTYTKTNYFKFILKIKVGITLGSNNYSNWITTCEIINNQI